MGLIPDAASFHIVLCFFKSQLAMFLLYNFLKKLVGLEHISLGLLH